MRMRSGPAVLLTLAAALLIPHSLFAHHSSAAYDIGKKVILKGTVKEWVYSNPHCFLILEVKNEAGEVVLWTNETQAPSVIFPVGYNDDGQPINIQLLGRAWDDDKLVGFAYAFEEIANAAGHGHVEATTAPPLKPF